MMNTRALLRIAATSDSAERQQASEELAANRHYPALLNSLAELGDTRLTFWVLDLLIRHFSGQLQRDASQAIPLLLGCLALNDGPVSDRVAWALSIIGQPAVEALLAAIMADPDAMIAAHYMGALKRNSSLWQLAPQVLQLLNRQLDSKNEQVRYWALVVLMDISPLRLWFDSRIPTELFEPLYAKLLLVSQNFIASGNSTFDFAFQYEKLLTQYLADQSELFDIL